jgi:hypothetical protein
MTRADRIGFVRSVLQGSGLFGLLVAAAVGCSSVPPSPASPDGGTPPADAAPGTGTSSSKLTFQTATFQLQPGDEKFICSTATYEQAINITRFDYGGQKGVHHIVMVRTTAPAPAGPFECDSLFDPTWLPLFVAGASAASLQLPDDTTHVLPPGSQVLVQLHLLNASPRPISGRVSIDMGTVPQPAVNRAQLFAFGTTDIQLAPHANGSAGGDCTLNRDLDIFGIFPHMHTLGTRMTVQAGPSADQLQDIYSAPWDFNMQAIFAMNMSLKQGQFVRVTCDYDNTTDNMVTFGESTHDEMCFFAVFVKDSSADGTPLDASCVGGAGGGMECTATENEKGIGRACTHGGGECKTGTACSADFDGSTSGICISLSCTSSDACGSGANCCKLPQAGGIALCLPDSCTPGDCTPVN